MLLCVDTGLSFLKKVFVMSVLTFIDFCSEIHFHIMPLPLKTNIKIKDCFVYNNKLFCYTLFVSLSVNSQRITLNDTLFRLL